MTNSQTRYTTGPWKVGTRHPGRVMAETGRGNVIAYCTPNPDDTDAPTAEEAANTQLIAAAPTLLTALKQTLDALHNETASPWIESVKQQASDAIAQAEKGSL